MSQHNKIKKRKARESSPSNNPVPGASSSTVNASSEIDRFTKMDVFQNTSTFLEILKNVGDVSQVLGPLKAICGVLKVVTDTAVLLKSNGEDLEELVQELNRQQGSIEDEIHELSELDLGKTNNLQGIFKPIVEYYSDLKELNGKLEALKARYDQSSARKRVKKILMANSDQKQIAGITKRMERSFQDFMGSITKFIARQTLLLRNEVAAMQENISRHMEEKDIADTLSKLPYANVRGNQHESCAEGTRVAILQEIANWVSDASSKPILAFIDRAGTGKSTIAATMAREWEKDGLLLTRFFFSKPTIINAKDLATIIARDIAETVPSLSGFIVDAVKQHPNFAACPLREQLEWLVFGPLKLQATQKIMIIDALDECSKEDRGILLKSLLDFIASFQQSTSPLKVLLTCRPGEDIVSRIREQRYAASIHQCMTSLYSCQNENNEADIRLYATRLLDNYLSAGQLEQFIKRADGLFIWAATVQKFITEALDPSSRFEGLMNSDLTHSPLSALYNEILEAPLTRIGRDGEEILRKVIGVIGIAQEPLVVEAIDELLGLRDGVASRVVMMLQSVLTGGGSGEPVQIMHPTFLEHIQDSKSGRLAITDEEAEPMIGKGCLTVLLSGLKYDICSTFQSTKGGSLYDGFEDDGFEDDESEDDESEDDESEDDESEDEESEDNQFEDESEDNGFNDEFEDDEFEDDKFEDFRRRILEQHVREKTTPGLRYAAVYALSHVMRSLHSQDVVEKLRTFFRTKILNWIEFMSLLDKIIILIQAVYHLKEHINKTISKGQCSVTNDDLDWCEDILTMVRPFQSAIEKSASQVYLSALPFIPVKNQIAACYLEQFTDQIPRVIRGRQANKQQALVLGGHLKSTNHVVYSPDNRYLVSASDDRTVRVWDSVTGAAIHTLTGHTGRVVSLTMSPDGQHVVSGSRDAMICIWEITTGVPLHTLSGHARTVRCLAFSPCGRYIASGSDDNTVRIWDSITGSNVQVLTSHAGRILCVSFSPDGYYLVSGSKDSYLRIYNAMTGATIHTLDGYGDPVWSLAFSPDGHYLASLSKTINIWDVKDGVLIRTLGSETELMDLLLFSPDGKYIISASTDNTVWMWETATSVPIHTLIGHTETICCIAISFDGCNLASGAEDNTVYIWNSITGAPLHVFTECTGPVQCLSFSPNGQYLASGSNDSMLYIWDLRAASAYTGYTEGISGRAFSLDEGPPVLESVDKMHDMMDSGLTHKNTGHTDLITCVKFSLDGRYLASGSEDKSVCIWDPVTGENIHTMTGHTSVIGALDFSPDGHYLASGSEDATVRIWDIVTGASIGEPLHHPDPIHSVSFHSQQGILLLVIDHAPLITSPTSAIDDSLDITSTTVWNLSTSPPSQHPIEDLPMVSKPTNSLQIEFRNPQTYIPSAGILFSLPSYFACLKFCSYEGKLAYGGQDGSVIIIDCSHLL